MKVKNRTIADIMTALPITVKAADTLGQIHNIFDQHNIHHIPVINDEQQLLGIISKLDYATALDAMTPFGNSHTQQINRRRFDSIVASDIMHKEVITLHPSDIVEKAVQIFRENQFKCLPIVDEENRLQGIVTTYDLMTDAYGEPQIGSP